MIGRIRQVPKYDYACKNCEREFEVEKSISDPHPEKCLECGGQLSRIFTPAAVQFKGSGFYKTDNK